MNRTFFSFLLISYASFAALPVGGERNAMPKEENEQSVEPHHDHDAVKQVGANELSVEPHHDHGAVEQVGANELSVEPHHDHEAVKQVGANEMSVEPHHDHEAVKQVGANELSVEPHHDHEAVEQVGGERNPMPQEENESSIEPHYDHEAVTQKEADASEAGLGVLREFFKPKTGEMAQLLVSLEETNKASTKAAKSWTQKSYEAMKGAHRVLVQSTNRAQNVLMHDGLRVNAAVKGQFHNEMAMLDPLSLDPKVRQRVRLEHGAQKLLPLMPEKLEKDSLKGIKVLINSRYHGENAHLVRGHHGTIEEYLPGKAKWRMSLDSDSSLKPELDITEFEMLPHDDVKLLGTHESPSGNAKDPSGEETLSKKTKETEEAKRLREEGQEANAKAQSTSVGSSKSTNEGPAGEVARNDAASNQNAPKLDKGSGNF